MNRSSTSIDRLHDAHMRFHFLGCTFLKPKKGNRWGERKRGRIVQRDDERALPEGPGREDAPGTAWARGERQGWRRELYIGRLIRNRLRYVKNPDTSKRISRLNPKAEWITKEIPALRIVSAELWNAATNRQSATRRTITRAGNIGFARRPQYLFSALSKCGVCGAGFIMAGRNRLACFGAREIRLRRQLLDSRDW